MPCEFSAGFRAGDTRSSRPWARDRRHPLSIPFDADLSMQAPYDHLPVDRRELRRTTTQAPRTTAPTPTMKIISNTITVTSILFLFDVIRPPPYPTSARPEELRGWVTHARPSGVRMPEGSSTQYARRAAGRRRIVRRDRSRIRPPRRPRPARGRRSPSPRRRTGSGCGGDASAISGRRSRGQGGRRRSPRRRRSRPPSTGAAIGRITSAPTPSAQSIGAMAMMVVPSVRSLGRRRWIAPSRIASRSSATERIFSRPPRSAMASLR